MHKISSREKMLAIALGVIAFLIVNLLFLPKLTTANRLAKQKGKELKAELTAADGWIKQSAYWKEREDWLEKEEPTLTERGNASATQIEELQKFAQEFGLQLKDLQLLSPKEAEFYHPVGVRFSLVGPWASVVRFLAELQTPTLFDVIPRISIRSATEPSQVHCEIELQRWFHTPADEVAQ
jgi:Tfp pilus assembly protein PilO